MFGELRRGFAIWLVVLLLFGCGGPRIPADGEEPARILERGYASYYHDSLHGDQTANGERYDRDELTAAHRSLPFGTRVVVTNLQNDRKVVLRINDRGPFVEGRILDVSRRAAEQLDFVREGVVPVSLRILDGEP